MVHFNVLKWKQTVTTCISVESCFNQDLQNHISVYIKRVNFCGTLKGCVENKSCDKKYMHKKISLHTCAEYQYSIFKEIIMMFSNPILR